MFILKYEYLYAFREKVLVITYVPRKETCRKLWLAVLRVLFAKNHFGPRRRFRLITQFSFTIWRVRAIARLSSGTSSVMVEPAAT